MRKRTELRSAPPVRMSRWRRVVHRFSVRRSAGRGRSRGRDRAVERQIAAELAIIAERRTAA
jgi:hypothetical protein